MFYNLLRRTLLENPSNNYNQKKAMEFQEFFTAHFQVSTTSCLVEPSIIQFYTTHSQTLSSLIRKQKYRTEGEVNIKLLEDIIRVLVKVISCQSCPFQQTLVMVNNIITLSNEKICYLISNQNVVNRICTEFKIFNDNYQKQKLSDSLTKNEESEMNFNLYSNLHLLLNLLSQENKLSQQSYLTGKLFNRSIINSFLEIDLGQIKNNQIHKLCCGIMSYFVKKADLSKWGSLFKKYILRSLDHLTLKNRQAMINSLRKVIRVETMSKQQVVKHKLLSFIAKALDGQNDHHYFNNLLQIVLVIIKGSPELSQNLYYLDFVPILTKLCPLEQSLAIVILQKLIPYMKQSEIQTYFYYFLKSFQTKSFNKYITKFLTSLALRLEGMTIIKAIEDNFLQVIGEQLKTFPTFTSVTILLDLFNKILCRMREWSQGFFYSILDRILSVNGLLELEQNNPEFRCLIKKFKLTFEY